MALWAVLGKALLIFCLRIADVSLGTVRTIMILRGMRKWAALLGFIEVTIWVVAVSQVIGNLDNILSVIGYSGGFATGTMVGMWIEDKLALGHVTVRIISISKGVELGQKIREAGFGATQLRAEGQSGQVHLIDVVSPRKDLERVLDIVNQVDNTAFVTVDEARQVVRGYHRLGR